MKFKTYLVGGAVRDEVLGIKSKDLDYVVLAPTFDALREAVLADGCTIFLETPECFTIRAKHPTLGCVDFVTGRKDGPYTDGRHPDSVEITTDLNEDLARRDFTCNAMAKDVETGNISDPFGGQYDLGRKVISCVGDAHKRFREDRLRPFRALRFSITKGLDIGLTTALAILELKEADFDCVSTERIRAELLLMFKANTPRSAYMLFREYAILGAVANKRGIWLKPTTEQ